MDEIGAEHKRPSHKIAKLKPSLLVRNMFTLPQSPFLFCPCGHTIILEKSFATKPPSH